MDVSLLYAVVRVPETVHMEFLGFFHLGEQSAILALLAGASQFFHTRLTLGDAPPVAKVASFANDMARSMHVQMKYVFPVMIAFVTYIVVAAVPLYFFTSNLCLIGQELIMRKRRALTQGGTDFRK